MYVGRGGHAAAIDLKMLLKLFCQIYVVLFPLLLRFNLWLPALIENAKMNGSNFVKQSEIKVCLLV